MDNLNPTSTTLQPQVPDVSGVDPQVANCLEAAEKYLAKGYSVIPVGRDKIPLIPWTEYQKRLATIEEVRAWYKQWPWAGVGIVTGKISNLVVFDIDPGYAGEISFNKFDTVRCKTGRGGGHLYFLSPGYEIRSFTGLLPHLDVRAEGGLVVAPPSLHPSGNRYVWEKNILDNTPLALPEELANLIKSHEIQKSKFDPEILEGVSEGNRNESAASIAGKIIRGLHEKEWSTVGWELLSAWNSKNNPPLAESELNLVFRSICQRERLNRLNNSIPPQQSLEKPVVESNTEAPTILSWSDFLAQKNSDSRDWLIKDFLRPGWLAVLGGHGKHGKSTLAFHLVNALRVGGNFIYPCKKVPVTYINCEMHPDDVRDLLRSVSGGNAIDGSTSIVNQPPVPLSLPWVESILNKDNPGVCVIDSFRGAFLLSGDNENNSGNVGASILRPLQNIARRTGWSIIVIHHFKKSGTNEALDLAGSGEWTSAPDVIYTWSCPNFKEPGKLKILGRVPPSDELSIKVSRETVEFLGTVPENEIVDEREKVKDTLTDEFQSIKDIADATKIPPSTVGRRLKELLSSNLAEKQGKGVRGSAVLWRNVSDNSHDIVEVARGIFDIQTCPICQGTDFWTRSDGVSICSKCYPSIDIQKVVMEEG
jgi:hypothetical protein